MSATFAAVRTTEAERSAEGLRSWQQASYASNARAATAKGLLEVLAAQVERLRAHHRWPDMRRSSPPRDGGTLRTASADRRLNHSVVGAGALDLPDRELLVPPYTLGAWLGDGSSAAARITAADREIIARIEVDGVGLRRFIEIRSDTRYGSRNRRRIAQVRDCVVCGKQICA